MTVLFLQNRPQFKCETGQNYGFHRGFGPDVIIAFNSSPYAAVKYLTIGAPGERAFKSTGRMYAS